MGQGKPADEARVTEAGGVVGKKRRRRRRRSKDTKDAWFKFRLPREEKERWELVAERRGTSVSAWLRGLASTAATLELGLHRKLGERDGRRKIVPGGGDGPVVPTNGPRSGTELNKATRGDGGVPGPGVSPPSGGAAVVDLMGALKTSIAGRQGAPAARVPGGTGTEASPPAVEAATQRPSGLPDLQRLPNRIRLEMRVTWRANPGWSRTELAQRFIERYPAYAEGILATAADLEGEAS